MLGALRSTHGAGTALNNGQPYSAQLPMSRYTKPSFTHKAGMMILLK